MKCEKLSKSAIECFNECEWKYYLQYIAGIRTPSNRSAVLGNMIHKVLEILALQKLRKKHTLNLRRNDYKYLTQISYNWFQRKNPDIIFKNGDLEFCLENIEKILKSRYNPWKLKILAVEKYFEIKINKPGFDYLNKQDIKDFLKINGYIDLVVEVDKNTIEVIDYKTGNYRTDWITGKKKELEDFQNDLQLRMYAYAVHEMYPKYQNIMTTVNYINVGGPFSVPMGDEDRIKTLDSLRRSFRAIQLTKDPMRVIDDSTRKSQHFKCNKMCYFGTTKVGSESLCKAYYKAYNDNGFRDLELKELHQVTIKGIKK